MTGARICSVRRWLALSALCLSASAAVAAEPALRSLDVRGLRVGGTTTHTVDGDDLGKEPRLLLPFAAKQALRAGSTDKRATFDVTLDADVVPGYYHLRVVTLGGVSLPVVIGVDRLPQLPAAAPVTELPVALHGSVAGSGAVEVKFQGKAKQQILVEVEAQRLGSKLRPVVHLYGPKKLQLAWSWPAPALFGDTRLETTLPEDGTYTVSVHDAEYAAAPPSFFRLRIGSWSFADQVFPPVLDKGQTAVVDLLGMAAPVRVDTGAPKTVEVLPLAWPKDGLWSGPRPFVTFSSHAEFLRQPATDKLQDLPPGPVGVSGRLLVPYGEDRYRVAVFPGQKIRLEAFAERLGSPLDAALVVRNDKGDALARAEDSPGSLDPVLEYAVPDKVTSIIVGVVDSQGRGGPRGVYRLTVDPQVPGTNQDAFKLSTQTQRISLPIQGQIVVPVHVERRGYLGKIDLAANLPAGVQWQGATIPDGADGTLVTLRRSDADFAPSVTTWLGRSAVGAERGVVLKGHPLERLQPWLATEIAVAPANVKGDAFAVRWRDLAKDAGLVLGTKLALKVNVQRPGDKSTVKLTLLTSQRTPLVNNQPDPNKALRQEKPVELPAPPAAKEPATNIATDGEVSVLVPVDLGASVYDVTVQAELLAPDKKAVAVAYAPVQRLPVRQALIVKLTGTERIAVVLDPKKGAALKIEGKLERQAGLKGDVALVLTGLPAGAKADAVTVKADAADFTVNVVLPPNLPPGEIKGLKLSGSFAPNPKTPAVRVKSRDVALTLVVEASK
jgi:hypothetical protein